MALVGLDQKAPRDSLFSVDSKQMDSEHIEHFNSAVEPWLRRLAHARSTAVVTQLRSAVEKFKLDKAEADRALRIAALLRDLDLFRTLLAEAKPGSKMALHPLVLATLDGCYPAPTAFDHTPPWTGHLPHISNHSSGGAVWGSEFNKVSALHNLTAKAAADGDPAFAIRRSVKRIDPAVWSSLGIDVSSNKAAIFVVPSWLRQENSETKSNLLKLIDTRIAEVRAAFQLPRGYNAGRRTLHSYGQTNAEWVLMRRVLDAVWPLERGKPNSRQIVALKAIIDETTLLAAGYPNDLDKQTDELSERQKRTSPLSVFIGGDRKSAIITYRHQLATLNGVIALTEKCLNADGGATLSGELHGECLPEALFMLHKLRDWRREIGRRLETGDYLIHHTEAPRPSGQLLWLPAFPKSPPDLDDPIFLIELCQAALEVGKAPADPAVDRRKPRRR